MKKHIWLIVFLPLLTLHAFSQKIEPELRDILVTDLDNTITRFDFPEKKTFVIVILGPDCPISQKYIPVIEALRKSSEDEVDIIGVFPSYFSVEEVAAFKKEYALKFPCLIDHDMKVIDLLQAKVTPEVFLFAPGFKRQYSGAIDNWFYDLGTYRAEITLHYLKDAIESTRNGTRVNLARTEAIGCLIQYNRKSGEPDHMHH